MEEKRFSSWFRRDSTRIELQKRKLLTLDDEKITSLFSSGLKFLILLKK
jgi:hypothetical protein